MIIEYHRPKDLNEALSLLAREQPLSFPLGGGTVINRKQSINYAVVDLQDLGLGDIFFQGNLLHVGATVTLQKLIEQEGLPAEFTRVIELETTYNLRQMATIAGSLVASNGRSPLAAALLAVDASIVIQTPEAKPRSAKIGDWLPMRDKQKANGLITEVSFATNLRFAYEFIARTPADQPIICVAVGGWKSGRTRIALGGWGDSPILAMDGPDSGGFAAAAWDACSNAGDQWGSTEYRQEMAGILCKRCLERINQ